MTTDNKKQNKLLEKGEKLNGLSTIVCLIGFVLHIFADFSLIAVTIIFVGLWLYTWALHLAPLYTFLEKDIRSWKICRFILLISMSTLTLFLLAYILLHEMPFHYVF